MARKIDTILGHLGACWEGRQWAERHPKLSMQQLWEKNPNGKELIWYCAHVGVPRRLLTLAAVACVRPLLRLVPDGLKADYKEALDTAEWWCNGEATAASVVRIYENFKGADTSLPEATRNVIGLACGTGSAIAAVDWVVVAEASHIGGLKAQRRCANIIRKVIPYAEVRKARLAWEKRR